MPAETVVVTTDSSSGSDADNQIPAEAVGVSLGELKAMVEALPSQIESRITPALSRLEFLESQNTAILEQLKTALETLAALQAILAQAQIETMEEIQEQAEEAESADTVTPPPPPEAPPAEAPEPPKQSRSGLARLILGEGRRL